MVLPPKASVRGWVAPQHKFRQSFYIVHTLPGTEGYVICPQINYSAQ